MGYIRLTSTVPSAFEEEAIARKRWRRTLLTIVLSLVVCCGMPCLFVIASVNGWPIETPRFALRTTTGLAMPSSADVRYFQEHGDLAQDLEIRFVAPKADVIAFLAQKPLAQAEWSRYDRATDSDESQLKPPYRSTAIGLSDGSRLEVGVEEHGEKFRGVWVNWYRM